MADAAHEYLPLGNPPSTPMLATSSRPATLPIKQLRSTDDDQGPRQRARTESQAITTQGISGNASVVNVCGDHITHISDGLGPDTYAVLESIEVRLKVVHDAFLDDKVDGWLAAPDVSQNLNAALRRRQSGTGAWFLDGAQFAEWKENPNIVLCIFGAPGSGKTVLSSSIVEVIKGSCTNRPLAGWAYFFFDSRNANKGLRLYENFLRSVLSQLCSRCDGVPGAVEALYRSHGKGRETPSVQALEDTLREVIEAFDDVYIVIDSLDECGDRAELLQWIQTVASWNSAKCHILATTRPDPDIKIHLNRISDIRSIYLQGPALEKDIGLYVDKRLLAINHWSEEIRQLVWTTLVYGADGMFRWVAMQMDSLQHCLKAKAVREKLKALPKDLEETYEQLLSSSPHQDDLLPMLHWLAFSARELRLEEIAEVLSVDFDAPDGPCYDPDLKYSNPSIALTVCTGLVTEADGIVKLAHFSVKEYLISDRIKTGIAAQFSMSARLSHSVIAQTCIAYLLIFNKPDSIQIPVTATGPFPLHLYAAEYTSSHLSLTNTASCPTLQGLLLKLFTSAQRSDSALVNWVRMYECDDPWRGVGVWLHKPANKVASPLYYASWLGLEGVVEHLLECGENINLLGGNFGTALQAAAYKGSIGVLELLLERGADPDIQGGAYETALLAAVWQGSIKVVELLLERGVNPNIKGGHYGTALQAAAYQGSIENVKLLLEHGADPNIKGGVYGTALQAAAWQGSIKVVELLLECRADPNIQGGDYGTALQAASYKGSIEVVELLLEHDADPDIQGGEDETALHAAAWQGSIKVVELLLERGADPNIQGGDYGTALQTAAYQGSIEVVKLLLEHGADPDVQGGEDETALHAAAGRGFIKVVELLLERGVDPNIQGVHYGTALQAASYKGSINVVELLLERGADPDIQGGEYGTALQAAAYNGSIKMVKLLLDHGADLDIKGGHYGTALQAAAYKGSIEVVELLLEHDADPDIPGGEYGTLLQEAAYEGSIKMVKLLLEHGANPDIKGGEYGTALQAAAYEGSIEKVKLLLEHGADPNIQGGEYGTVLQAAAYEGSVKVVKLLLELGADPNTQGGIFGTALQAAAWEGSIEVVKLLLEHGADPNTQGGESVTALQAAAQQGSIETVNMLLEYGADPDIHGGGYGTALQAAARAA